MVIARSIASAVVATMLFAGAVLLPACRAGGEKSVEKANDDLRRTVLDLEGKVAALQGRNAELTAKLEESERARAGALPKDVLEAIPRCVGVSIGGLSGYQPARRDQPAKIVIDLEPTDALGRFVQIVGTLHVEARALGPVGSDAKSGEALEAELGPAQLREAYRGGLLGPRYTVEIPASGVWPPGDLVMRVRFVDALTGRSHDAELTRPLRAAAAGTP